jgi:hypothetical protein
MVTLEELRRCRSWDDRRQLRCKRSYSEIVKCHEAQLIIQVPWLPLHGIQFRRISGDAWAYQQLAKTALKEMRL